MIFCWMFSLDMGIYCFTCKFLCTNPAPMLSAGTRHMVAASILYYFCFASRAFLHRMNFLTINVLPYFFSTIVTNEIIGPFRCIIDVTALNLSLLLYKVAINTPRVFLSSLNLHIKIF